MRAISTIIILIFLLEIPLESAAQPTDSIAMSPQADSVSAPSVLNRAVALGAGAALFGAGLAGRYSYSRDYRVPHDIVRSDRGTDYLQFAPMALPWVMKIAGQPTRSGYGRMAVSQGIAGLILGGSVYTLKHWVGATRPDNSDARSFPSGHSAWAFMGATVVAHELGWRSPWYTVGAYAFATGIAVERVVDRHHFPTDVIAGAGIGIMATEIGYYLGDLIFGNRQLDYRYRRSHDLRVNSNFSYFSLSTGLSLPIGRVRAGSTVISRLPALSAALRGGWAIDDNWGLAVELGLLSTPLVTDVNGYRTFVKSLSSLGFVVMPYYNHVLSSHVSFSGEIGGGYRHNFALNALDHAIEAGGGTPLGRINFGVGLRLSDHFTARASVGYEVSRYEFTVHPSTAYMTTSPAACKGTASSILINLSSRYEF